MCRRMWALEAVRSDIFAPDRADPYTLFQTAQSGRAYHYSLTDLCASGSNTRIGMLPSDGKLECTLDHYYNRNESLDVDTDCAASFLDRSTF